MLRTKDIKLQFLGIIPQFSDPTGTLNPEQIAALSALLTFKGKSVKGLLQETVAKGQDLAKKVRVILNKSSLRGHASVATTPTLAISFESSKFLDSMLTGMNFSSSLMASGRRTNTTCEDIVYPTAICANPKAKQIYQKQSEDNLECQNWLIEKGVAKDEASKILQYGIYGTGIMVLPIESIVGFMREVELEADWMPEEAKMLADWFAKNAKAWGIGQLLATRRMAPRDIYPYPNIFKDPKKSNLAREAKKEIDCQLIISHQFKSKLKELLKLTKQISKDKKKILSDWQQLVSLRREICRDYNLNVSATIYSQPSWRVWGEKKRHRTVPQVVDSIYYSLEKAGEDKKNNWISIPPTVKKNPEFLKRFLKCMNDSLVCYKKLLKMGIKPRDALFVIPRGIRINVIQKYDLYNLISGYYPTRLCTTVEEQLLQMTRQEQSKLRQIFAKKKLAELGEAIVVKCQTSCFCHEEHPCSQIQSLVTDYDEEFHKQVLNNLEEKSLNL